MITLDDVRAAAREFQQGADVFAHLATVSAQGTPDVVPIAPGWEGDTLWVMSHDGSVKVRNIMVNPSVALHWQVTVAGDGVALWGQAEVFTDIETKRRLWTGIFDYDLNDFSPGGPDAPGSAFVAVHPTRAVIVKQYGLAGVDRWTAPA
ncbi:MAG: pyridoxamine 5'-phosphate oxidase family protein [Acidimicrobiia bacterium]